VPPLRDTLILFQDNDANKSQSIQALERKTLLLAIASAANNLPAATAISRASYNVMRSYLCREMYANGNVRQDH